MMKWIAIFIGIGMCSTVQAQNKRMEVEEFEGSIKQQRAMHQPKHKAASLADVFGDFEIVRYRVLSKDHPNKKELESLIGSLVKVSAEHLTGSEIDPVTYDLFEIEQMARGDFIYRAFGRSIRAPEPDLPSTLKVHKTDNQNCYGIIDLDKDQVAVPYKGVLLFLKRK